MNVISTTPSLSRGRRNLAFLVFLSSALCPPSSASAEEPYVRVAILQDAESARVTVEGPARLTDLDSGAGLADWPDLKWKLVESAGPGIKIGEAGFPSRAVLLTPAKNPVFRVNSRAYRGALILRRSSAGKLTVVNRLPLEEYLVGALTSETSPKWPMEALKAHAVVSRTMVAHRIWIRKNESFDVTADTSTHLYYGKAAERGRTRQAVEETQGQVLAYQGELFSATFHANCGGHTESAAELWQTKKEVEPLAGVVDPNCRDLRHYRWKMFLSHAEMARFLEPAARGAGELQGLEVLDRNASGRVREIRITGTEGEAVLTGRRLRELLGANRLRSLKFTVTPFVAGFSFSGFGWGHGVGFCQWGAYGMARRGKKMDEILSFYFPGAQRRKLPGLPGFVS
ncbi:MAG: SpoIID/LytB domain-containing protein [Candidatus Omnitrophica bacterium]|nr:SpoIID/LytB domain-containing protein [Candidatus Omnitrophota bacterium]